MADKQEIIEAKPQALVVPETPAGQAAAMLQVLREVALAPNVNVEAMRAIMDMQRQLTKDQAERSFNMAMAQMAAEMPRIKKKGKVEYLVDKNDKKGPKEEAFKFAKYEDIDRHIRPLLVKYGFSLSFTTEPRPGDGGGLTMVGTLSHIEGHSRDGRIAVALDNSGGKNNIQGMGSSSSYGKRYVTCSLLNIITEGEDDDGNKAETITVEEAAALDLRLRAISESYREKFLKWAGVSIPTDIKSTKYPAIIKELETVEKKAKEKKGS